MRIFLEVCLYMNKYDYLSLAMRTIKDLKEEDKYRIIRVLIQIVIKCLRTMPYFRNPYTH